MTHGPVQKKLSSKFLLLLHFSGMKSINVTNSRHISRNLKIHQAFSSFLETRISRQLTQRASSIHKLKSSDKCTRREQGSLEKSKTMEAVSKRRKPLSDRTNTFASADNSSVSSSSSSVVKPKRIDASVPVSSVFKKLLNDVRTDTCNKRNDDSNRTSASSNPSEPTSSLPPPRTPARSPPLELTSASGTGKHEGSEPCTVYSRRKSARITRSRQKEIAKPTIFSPAAKTESKRDKMNKVGNTCASKSCTVPQRKKPRGILSKQDDSDHALPKDFIEKQREYFAEIDAFELLEEEVKSDDDVT